MDIIDNLRKKQEIKFLTSINSNNVDEKKLLKYFNKSKNKNFFISSLTLESYPESLKNAIIEYGKTDNKFIIDNVVRFKVKIAKNSLYNFLINFFSPKEIANQLFNDFDINIEGMIEKSLYTYLDKDERKKIMSQITIDDFSIEALKCFNENMIVEIINFYGIQKISKEILELLSLEEKNRILNNILNSDEITKDEIFKLFDKDYVEKYIVDKLKQDNKFFNNRLLSLLDEDKRNSLVTFAKLNLALEYKYKNYNEESKKQYLKNQYLSDSLLLKFVKYLDDNNLINYTSLKPDQHLPFEKILNKYQQNIDLIKSFFEQDISIQNNLTVYFNYVLTNDIVIPKVDDLKNIPTIQYNKEVETIEKANKNQLLEIIIKNLTGFDLETFMSYKDVYLENHNIEYVLSKNNENEKLKNLMILKDLCNLTETFDETQLKEFALNISKRNFEDLSNNIFLLSEMRNSIMELLNNVKSQYGKEMVNNLGYEGFNKSTMMIDDKTINIKNINGKFNLLVHKTIGESVRFENNRSCLSLITEGKYDTFNPYGSNNDMVMFIFEKVQPEFLFASSSENMSSNSTGDKNSNFQPIDVTTTSISVGSTEQVFMNQGFDKNGIFIQNKPSALGSFVNPPSKKTLQLAASLGLDIIIIPDMEQNLQNMFDNNEITPGLTKSYKNGFLVFQSLLNKKEITEQDIICLQILKSRDDMAEYVDDIDKIISEYNFIEEKRNKVFYGRIEENNIIRYAKKNE